LLELSRAQAIRTPRTICAGIAEDHSFIVMEYIEFGGHGDMAASGCSVQPCIARTPGTLAGIEITH
jgi:fructosamine-3-kinase